MKKYLVTLLTLVLFVPGVSNALLDRSEEDYELKLLGKYLFFEKISSPPGQSCATCHDPGTGWVAGNENTHKKSVAVPGANPQTIGVFKPPTNAYAVLVPNFDFSIPAFGLTWNGKALGTEVESRNVLEGSLSRYQKYLGPFADTDNISPFTLPFEQGFPNKEAACLFIEKQKFAPLFSIAYDGAPLDCTPGEALETTFARFAVAIAAYNHSTDLLQFASKWDAALANDADGEIPFDDFTPQEQQGQLLFFGDAGCFNCHASGSFDGNSPDEQFTSARFENIGTPRNFEIPGMPEPDIGVAAVTGDPAHTGLRRIPTLRNVDKRRRPGFVKAFTRNGWFKSLDAQVHFYNTRDIKPACPVGTTQTVALQMDCWPVGEFPETQNPFIGNLMLTPEEETAIVAFLKTLTDIPTPRPPKPFNLRKFNRGADLAQAHFYNRRYIKPRIPGIPVIPPVAPPQKRKPVKDFIVNAFPNIGNKIVNIFNKLF